MTGVQIIIVFCISQVIEITGNQIVMQNQMVYAYLFSIDSERFENL